MSRVYAICYLGFPCIVSVCLGVPNKHEPDSKSHLLANERIDLEKLVASIWSVECRLEGFIAPGSMFKKPASEAKSASTSKKRVVKRAPATRRAPASKHGDSLELEEVPETELIPENESTCGSATPLGKLEEDRKLVKLTMQLIRLRALTEDERKGDADAMYVV